MSALLPTRRTRILASLWLVLLCGSIGLVLFFTGTSPASASINMLFASPTPTQENLWAYVDIPKPAPTSVPTLSPTSFPAEPVEEQEPAPGVTEGPAAIVMEIVEDTAALPGVPEREPAPSVPSYGGSKYILVDISEQHMYVYDGDTLVWSFVASTGMGNSTRIGTFAVQSKIPSAYGSTWNIWMPSWLGIYWSHGLENGIHALPILPSGAILWEGYLGTPVSYGCVVLGTYEAQLLYDWAEIGTPVEIQW
ncbi:MAG TPA: L,D-transpeptidase family protein [Anaerolineales bacterium]|nr:L,D-transpeptidase family protein [Anaerolineales bacterium]